MKSSSAVRADSLTPVSAFRKDAFWRWLLILSVTYPALLSLPMPRRVFATGLDASWMLGLNWAHAEGLVAGRDIVFTYGPLGYLIFPDVICGAPAPVFAFRVGLYLLSVAAMYRLAWILPSKMTAFWSALILGLGVALDGLSDDNQILIVVTAVSLLSLVDRSRWRFAELCVLSFLAGLGTLLKLNHGAEAIALFLTVVAAVALRDRPLDGSARRWLTAALVCLPLSIVVLFWGATGSLTALGPYLANGWQIVSGYSEAMSLPGPLWQAALALTTLIFSFSVVLAVCGDRRALAPGLAPALISAFFVFKHAMVRQVGHAPSFHIKLAVGLLFLLVCARLPRDRRLILAIQLFSISMCVAISSEIYPWFEPRLANQLMLREALTRATAFLHWPGTWERLGTQAASARSGLVLPGRVHRLIGNASVDAIPWDVDVVRANGWRWQPRPVFQSYSAYTPALDRLNAEHLESSRTADFVLLNFSAIDGRHPFLETPDSWRALLDRYQLVLTSESLFVLRKGPGRRFGDLQPAGHALAHWDEDIPVPAVNGMLIMAPHLTSTLEGRATTFLFRSAAVYMEGSFRSGRRFRWRCVPRNMADGFLIHPFPQDLAELRGLFLADPAAAAAADRIATVRFHTDKPSQFAGEIPVDWSRLPIASGRVSSNRPLPQAALTPLWLPKDPAPQPVNAHLASRRDRIEMTPLNGDPQLLFDIGPALGQFNTIVVRALFQKSDRMDAFFGKQVDGRGVSGVVPVTNQWVDVYLNLSQNLFWADEHGTVLRFDPVSSSGPGTSAYIAGIWGSIEAAPASLPEIQFYPVPAAQAPSR